MIRDDVALAHVRAVLEAPSGPLEGRHEATYTLVLSRQNGMWEATAFHITLATPTPEHWAPPHRQPTAATPRLGCDRYVHSLLENMRLLL